MWFLFSFCDRVCACYLSCQCFSMFFFWWKLLVEPHEYGPTVYTINVFISHSHFCMLSLYDTSINTGKVAVCVFIFMRALNDIQFAPVKCSIRERFSAYFYFYWIIMRMIAEKLLHYISIFRVHDFVRLVFCLYIECFRFFFWLAMNESNIHAHNEILNVFWLKSESDTVTRGAIMPCSRIT